VAEHFMTEPVVGGPRKSAEPVVVVAALIKQSGKLLICQRSARSSFAGRWEFAGGKVEPGEAPEPALRRELQEELEIDAEIGPELWRVTHQYEGRRPVTVLFFAVLGYSGTPVNRVFEQISWVAAHDLFRFDFLDADRALVKMLAEGEIIVPEAAASQP
jgi:8-oxo-dGTP diphosphatase